MKTLEESIAAAMDVKQDTALIPFLPYIFQDFWELGTPPEIVTDLIRKHGRNYAALRVLDVGCGKGAVSVQLAAALKCNCYGIDGIPEFIEASRAKAREYGVDTLCRFEVGDVREKIKTLGKFDVIIVGATGPIFGDYQTALAALSGHLADDGFIIVEEAYIDDASEFQHPPYLLRKDLVDQFSRAGMELVDETVLKYSEVADISWEMETISRRCRELEAKYPEKSSLFENYIQNQAAENDALENELTGSAMVVKIKKGK